MTMNTTSYNTSFTMSYPHRSAIQQISILVILIIIFIISVCGNVCVCYIIVKNVKLRRTSMMAVFNLAVTDFLFTGTSIPVSVVVLIRDAWPWDEDACLLSGMLMLILGIASLITLAFISFTRYIAICHPVISKRYLTRNIYLGSIVVIWIIAITISFPPAAGWGHIEYSYGKAACTHYWPSSISYTLFLITLAVFIPFIAIFILYSLLFYNVWVSTKRIRDKIDPVGFTRSDVRLAKVSAGVFFGFLVCWLPISITNFFELSGVSVSHDWNMFAMLLMYSNSICNPIIYSLMSSEFRSGFKHLFCCESQNQNGGSGA